MSRLGIIGLAVWGVSLVVQAWTGTDPALDTPANTTAEVTPAFQAEPLSPLFYTEPQAAILESPVTIGTAATASAPSTFTGSQAGSTTATQIEIHTGAGGTSTTIPVVRHNSQAAAPIVIIIHPEGTHTTAGAQPAPTRDVPGIENPFEIPTQVAERDTIAQGDAGRFEAPSPLAQHLSQQVFAMTVANPAQVAWMELPESFTEPLPAPLPVAEDEPRARPRYRTKAEMTEQEQRARQLIHERAKRLAQEREMRLAARRS